MPTYEYECKSCGHTFEAFQAMSDAPLKECPQCGKEVRRLIHGGTGVIFKGSGFYVTDKGKGSGKAASSAAKPADTSPVSGASEKNASGGQSPAASADGASGGGSAEKKSDGEGKAKPSEGGQPSSGGQPSGEKQSVVKTA